MRIVDIREPSEWETGWIPGGLRVPTSELSDQLEEHRDRTLVIYCAHGNRSLRVADALAAAGYGDPVSLAGGIVAWERAGLPVETPAGLGDEQRRRYSRHLLIPEIGQAGQQRLLEAKILLIGAGGLGSPAALYLAAAGVGTLGIVDMDVVDASNLQRQILHNVDRIGDRKVDSAKKTLTALNPDVNVITHDRRLDASNIEEVI